MLCFTVRWFKPWLFVYNWLDTHQCMVVCTFTTRNRVYSWVGNSTMTASPVATSDNMHLMHVHFGLWTRCRKLLAWHTHNVPHNDEVCIIWQHCHNSKQAIITSYKITVALYSCDYSLACLSPQHSLRNIFYMLDKYEKCWLKSTIWNGWPNRVEKYRVPMKNCLNQCPMYPRHVTAVPRHSMNLTAYILSALFLMLEE